ncbi:MAG: hypothetical protein V4690_04430 [Patescibacteria group bacterium]
MLEKNYKKIIIALALLLVVSIGMSFKFYSDLDLLKNPEAAEQKEIASIVNKLGKLMELPQGETPTVATVTDPEKLKDQVFFVNSKVGDKVVVYEKSQKVILFRPSENKIIEVSPYNLPE